MSRGLARRDPDAGAAGPPAARRRDDIVPSARYADFLPEGQSVTLREPSPMARLLVVTLSVLFVSILLWSALAEVDQAATAPGVVRPAGRVKVINHPEGGRVAAILVREGEVVGEGQPLVELDPEILDEDVARARTDWEALSVEIARLEAESAGKMPAFPSELGHRRDLIQAQTALFRARKETIEARRATADKVIEQRRAELASLQEQVAAMKQSLDILVEQEQAIAELAGKGYFPRIRYLSIQREVAGLRGQLARNSQQIQQGRAALAEATERRVALDKDYLTDVLGDLNKLSNDRERVRAILAQQRSRQRNLVLRSPEDGIVQNLEVTGIGQAVRPSQPLMRIVPTGNNLVIEARVTNQDIGYVHEGQAATVKVRTYDFVKYGGLKGKVEKVAADATEDPRTGALTFAVFVRTEKTYLGRGPDDLPVNPGMLADVELNLGRRTVLSYLTDRVSRTIESSFKER
ncbi:MAG: HlyD family type I secretion periplasmic adaptor subunit [Alphaproteobacteria bacterium]